MGAIWLDGRTPGYPNVVDVLRAGGVQVAEYEGWTTRSRSSGGFNTLAGVVHHHTASNTTPASDLAYMTVGCPDAPVSNGLLDRTGLFTIIAAGAANHAGKGGPRGSVNVDSGNSNCFGIEAANAGQGGDPWPPAQIDAYLKMTAALSGAYGLSIDPLVMFSHHEWTLTDPANPAGSARKIDPAGPSPYPSVNSSGTWNMNAYRADAIAATRPQPPPEMEDFVFVTWQDKRFGNVFLLGEGGATQVDTPTLVAMQPKALAAIVGQHDHTLACCCTQAFGVQGNSPAEVIEAARAGGFLV